MAIIGFEKFFKPRKDFATDRYKKALEFFKYLQDNGYNINQATETIFKNFIRSKKLITTSQQKTISRGYSIFLWRQIGREQKNKAFSDMYG